MSDRHEVYCRDFHQGGQACTCECFTPPSNPEAPYYCWECQHGFSKHPEALDPTRDAPRKQDGTTSGKKRLISIFKEKTSSGSAGRSLPSAASSKSMLNQKILGVERARDEVMNGYRTGLNSQSNKVRSTQWPMCGTYKSEQLQFRRVTGKARATSQFDSEDKITKVAQWLLLVNCLDVNSEYISCSLHKKN